jgi:hypothetical protein
MLDELKCEDFAPYLNEPFVINADAAEPLEAELIEVTELGPASKAEGDSSKRATFSIVFRGPKDILLPQRIYKLEHRRMGTLELFLVPIGPDHVGMRYEALFA